MKALFSLTVRHANAERALDMAFDGVYIWFTERSANRIGRLNISTSVITEYTIPLNSNPTGIAVAPNGTVWFVSKPATNWHVSCRPAGLANTPTSLQGGMVDDVAVANDDSISCLLRPAVCQR
ncbi:MAG: hypothetical protein R3C44_02835 [Chloroflexota bacterium]